MDEEQTSRLFELADLILAVGRQIYASKEFSAEFAGQSWTPLESAVMRFIDRNPGASASAAAEATQMISSNFSRALRSLEKKGLVRREADQDDTRRVRLYPTELALPGLPAATAAAHPDTSSWLAAPSGWDLCGPRQVSGRASRRQAGPRVG